MALIGLVLSASLVGLRLYTAQISDANVKVREEALVANGVKEWIRDIEHRVVAQTTWDEALLNLGQTYNPAWAHENISAYLQDLGGFDESYVLSAEDRPLYAMRKGRDEPPATYGRLATIAEPLVANVRAVERRRLALGPPGVTRNPPAPVQASAVGLVDGLPAILSATLVQSDFGRKSLPGKAPVVVTVANLDMEFQRGFSSRFLLRNLHIHPVAEIGPGDVDANTMLHDSAGAPVARMDWTAERPAWDLFVRTLPAMVFALAVFGLVAAGLFLKGRSAARALIASETRAKHMAYHDHLTGLPNRALFSERMAQAMAEMRRSGRAVGVLVLDLDRFKLVNDTYGHGAGDELISDIASRLKSLTRESDIVARLGGDEFAIVYANADPRGLWILANRIVSELSRPIDLPFGRVFPGASIGITLVTDFKIDGDEALRQADLAMYRAKDAGRGRFQFYEPEMDMALKARLAMEGDLREALRAEALTMVYQPQFDGDGQVVGVEALVRWTHPERGPVPPAFFVSIAEECSLIDELGEFTLRRAFSDSLRWPRLTVAVNVSAIQIRAGDFDRLAGRLLRETGADPRRIELEITESILLEDDEVTHETLTRLRSMGFSLALDDFGTGYSSLAYLRRYPIDKIKIDRSFITNLGSEREAEAVVGAIVKLARALNLKVIAEGVETLAQRSGLRRAGCHSIQGFLYSPPIAADAVEALVAAPPAATDPAPPIPAIPTH
jgi:diguanylate cyclase (GGDEF)-like protein